MARVVLFGSGITARLIYYYLSHDSDHEVVAVAVDRDHVGSTGFQGLPLLAFDEIPRRFPPDDYKMLVALGYGRMNAFRAERYQDAKALGYELISYVSTRATIWPDTEIGDNCVIMEGATVQPFVSIGNDVTIWSAGHLAYGSRIGDHTFISSHVVVGGEAGIDERCFLGVNSTIADGVHIARESIVGAGALVDADTAEREVFSPARTIKLPVTSDRVPSV